MLGPKTQTLVPSLRHEDLFELCLCCVHRQITHVQSIAGRVLIRRVNRGEVRLAMKLRAVGWEMYPCALRCHG